MTDVPTTPPGGPDQPSDQLPDRPADRLPDPSNGGLRLRYTALSDVGRVRKDNQDSAYAGPYLLAVADGVGGSARGDVASSAAVEVLRALDAPPGNDLEGEVAAGIEAAHIQIAGLVEQNPELEGTSTTVTVFLFDGTRIGVAHVGDSRGYLLRGGQLRQVTKDHTFVQTLIDEGRITEAESRVHPHRNLILRAVDGVHESEPDLFLVPIEPGDRLMLCSDGASGVLDDQELADILVDGTAENAARDIIRAALDGGSTDNVTVVVADVVDSADTDPDETQAMLVGPIVVGAAAERRRGLGRRRPRHVDTGELDAVLAEPHPDGGTPRPVDPESVRYAPRPPRRFVWLRRLAVLAVVLVLLWAGGTAAYDWSQRQYYVAPAPTASGEKVAIYKGVETDLPLLTMHEVFEVSDADVDDLTDYNRGQVTDGMTTKDLAGARALVSRLSTEAACEVQKKEAAASPSPTPTPTRTPSRTPSGTGTGGTGGSTGNRTASPSAGPTATPTPSATPSSPSSGSTNDCSDG